MPSRARNSSTVRWLLVGCALAITVAAIVAATGDNDLEPLAIATGTIYSTGRGDSVDVVADLDDGELCINAGAFGYGSSISCIDERGAGEVGSYMVLLPFSGRGPAYVVGVMPEAAVGATVAALGEERRAETRGRWFTIELPEVNPDDASAVVVDFFT